MPLLHWIALLLLALGYAIALTYGSLGLAALPALLALLCSALLVRRPVRWQQSLGHLLFILLGIALALHWLPGFHGARVIDKAVLSEGAVPFSMYLNLDKPLIGLWLLLACPWLVMLRGRGLAMSLALILPLTLLACLGGASALGLVAWAPKWPDQAWLWLANNLLLVSLTEELLFRGYIQGGLQRLFKHEGLALLVAALLFGLAHLAGGWQWFYLATLAGVGYGLAYRHGGLAAAVLCHTCVNLAHFALFSYPMLVPS
ncbi:MULTISPECIES: CPBP family intramembrane glutamic endopeptidase [unclassified Pseudomonas]|uniref:CPBP family intramembrane glutamic endopeptidase n=1 Tax=unclassified Pseudomonas TaxID=196821 RepID=UPI000C8834E9|nr:MULTISPECIES: CPBP family intramembrane glutamic endopeptidase [unclassified Pseudomonas]PMZ97977.1 CPBP family intramembrane metalloprotease [Pseudomonas sp. FW305-42]PNA22535.1 CPBP family intramembrane metalloprotease [Pseudomonas sp. MPR-R1B]PNB26091.1 CPBP family intramembrane metalloprotease [Pseudomonas sp. DP16D-E2]PNB43626.1 CPBP family intramembrane metalloprotease [Pseudomonas sp. FW305-17]PNB61223.1 CPBP family intramembrane metalloprotease [Pseudomonas sp. GW531-E2]